MKLGNRFTGILRRDKVYVSYRTPYHFFRKFKGFGVSTSILRKLSKEGCYKVLIIYQETENTQILYSAHPNKFLEKGIVWKDGRGDYQRILPLTEFKRENNEEASIIRN